MVVSLVGTTSGWSDLVVSWTLGTETSVFSADGGETTHFSVFVDWSADPVGTWVSSDSLVGWVDEDDLVVFVGTVLGNPVRVQESETLHSSADLLFGDGSVGSGWLQLDNTLGSWLAVDNTFGDWSFTATTSDTDSVDDETLLCFVSQSSGLIWSGWSGASVDGGQLSVFPSTETKDEVHHIGLLLFPEFFEILVGSHCLILPRLD